MLTGLVIAAIVIYLVIINVRGAEKARDEDILRARQQTRKPVNNSSVNKTHSWPTTSIPLNPSEDSKWKGITRKVLERDGNKCTSCGSVEKLTVDHIQELSLGGSNNLNNLRTLCAVCHQDRHRRKFLEKEFRVKDDYGENYQASPKIIALNKAMRNGEGVGIKYVDAEGLYSERVIFPKEIYKSRYVYVNAYCELDKAIRVFRASRMKLCASRLNFYNNATNSYTSTWDPNKVWRSGNYRQR